MSVTRQCIWIGVLAGAGAFGAGCGSDQGPPEEQAKSSVKSQITEELDHLVAASVALRAAAPAPDADGWNGTADAAAVASMKAEWKKARVSYERIEGAIAVLFSGLDVSTDERYDGFIAEAPDTNLFDGEGVTGVHAIERILWTGSHPPQVVAFESALPGYQAARFPTTEAEARDFKDGLCKRLVDDTTAMRTMFTPLALDTLAAFRGVIGSLGEQIEKVMLAATGEDESRYAQNTLADMRANLEGGERTYAAFKAWVKSRPDGAALDVDVDAGFGRVRALYAAHSGDALPAVPAGFNPTAPAAADLTTPYGMIFSGLSAETDAAAPMSLVSKMTDAADLIGIPPLE